LTRLEFKLLSVLVQHRGRVLTHHFLLQEVWGFEKKLKPQVLRVLMAGLRRKVEQDPAQPRYLVTEQGVGYRLALET
jgi:two-component system KDP operon response regulator KdpE